MSNVLDTGDNENPEAPPPPPEEANSNDGVGGGVNTKNLKRKCWSDEEDERLADYIDINGARNWNKVAKDLGLDRSSGACRARWANHLSPDIEIWPFTTREKNEIVRLHHEYQNHTNKWTLIAKELPGRSNCEIRKFWNNNQANIVQPSMEEDDQIAATQQNQPS